MLNYLKNTLRKTLNSGGSGMTTQHLFNFATEDVRKEFDNKPPTSGQLRKIQMIEKEITKPRFEGNTLADAIFYIKENK